MPKKFIKYLDRSRGRLASSHAQFLALVGFLTIVFFTGGSSRDDVQSLIFLRPLSFIFGAYALTCMTCEEWRGRLFPLYIAIAFAGLMLLQLIPLPPEIWVTLPGREIFADIASMAGLEQPWRPLTLSPSRTLNSLFSIAVPMSAMMLYLNIEERHRKQMIVILILFAGISALWAMLQLAGSARGPLYLYRITNSGAAVGLFANRNHQAIFLATTIVMLGWYAGSLAATAKLGALKFYGSIAAIFIIVPLLFITGSRAGLVLMVPALAAAMAMIYFGRYAMENQILFNRSRAAKAKISVRHLILLGSSTLIILVVLLSIYLSRSLAFDRLVNRSAVEEIRTQLLPILTNMTIDYFPWGSGFGTFEFVYRIYEPRDMLSPTYLNQAHNDWLQIPIEGGLPAIAIAAGILIWATAQMLVLFKAWHSSRYTKYAATMAASALIFFLAGSIGDYPVFALLACFFVDSVRKVEQSTIRNSASG